MKALDQDDVITLRTEKEKVKVHGGQCSVPISPSGDRNDWPTCTVVFAEDGPYVAVASKIT